MRIHNYLDNKSAYAQALKDPTYSTSDRYAQMAQTKAQFKYSNLTRRKFKTKFSHRSWKGRALQILEAPFLAGWALLKMPGHSLQYLGAVLTFRQHKPLKVTVFRVIRDLEEASGRIVGVFNETHGAYLVQDAQFHKACYNEPRIAGKYTEEWTENSKLKELQGISKTEGASIRAHLDVLQDGFDLMSDILPVDLNEATLLQFYHQLPDDNLDFGSRIYDIIHSHPEILNLLKQDELNQLDQNQLKPAAQQIYKELVGG